MVVQQPRHWLRASTQKVANKPFLSLSLSLIVEKQLHPSDPSLIVLHSNMSNYNKPFSFFIDFNWKIYSLVKYIHKPKWKKST